VRRVRRIALAAAVAASSVVAACAVGQGSGDVTGNISLPDCDKDLSNYDMGADFFGAVASGNQLQIRIQQGGGTQEYADSLTITVNDLAKTLKTIEDTGSATYQVQLERLPGSPPWAPTPDVQMTLSLRATCGLPRYSAGDQGHFVIHAVSGTITFLHIFNGDINTRDTNAKRIQGSFQNVLLVDPREADPATGVPGPTHGTIQGEFSFFYQRGGPAQPFP
jgi:hypothetical protein